MGYLDSNQRPMGILGSVTMEQNWSAVFSRELMEDLKNKNEVDMVFHVGDVGYADDAVFHSIETAVQFLYEDAYNDYMDWMQNITSTLPYHVTPGTNIVTMCMAVLSSGVNLSDLSILQVITRASATTLSVCSSTRSLGSLWPTSPPTTSGGACLPPHPEEWRVCGTGERMSDTSIDHLRLPFHVSCVLII